MHGHSHNIAHLFNFKEYSARPYEAELVPGYVGAKITIQQLDVCLRKAKKSGTALARLLCGFFFSDETLAGSSARGTNSTRGKKDKRPALDSNIINAIVRK